MENITLNVIYDELKSLERLVRKVDQKVEHFMGFETLSKKELAKLKVISKETTSQTGKSLSALAHELGVQL